MTWEAWFTLGIILFQMGMLISTRTGPDVILLGGVTLLLVFNVLTPDEALGGLANEGMVTVGVLYVVVAGLRETGGIGWLVEKCLGRPRSTLAAQARLMPPVIAMSAFLNNTPVVAMLIPAVKEWAKNYRLPVSQLLIPLSYASILGGVCTLIGTSTNLVVYGLLLKSGFPELHMFEITRVGLPVAVLGFFYILLFGRKWLPNREPAFTALSDPREYTVEMIVEPDSPLDGKSIEEAGLRNLTGMFLIEVEREGRILPAVSPQERLKINDRLVFCGIVESVVDLQRIRGLKPATNQVFKLDSPRPDRCLIETVVSSSCALVGRTIRDGRFRNQYNAVVIAVARHGKRIHKKIGDIILQPGDTLLLEAHPSFLEQQKNSRDFYLISRVEDSHPLRHERSYIAMGILAGMVVCVTFGWLSMLKAAMLAAGLMLITQCCKVSTARRSVDWQVLMVIAASFALGNALEKSGLAHTVGHGLISLAGNSPWISLALVYLVTILFTELITNNAAAVLVFPIAMSTARDLGVNFMPFAVVIMMAASASFATPIGYQTNLMVYGPGGYHFTDYMKIGIPLGILVGVTVIGLTPLCWPF
ncbi:MAG TPA: SLC13 family permease [bacterium]|nr:SLC13 family permease [bacterium]HPP02541.1 SLC13 family permease [bacterium]